MLNKASQNAFVKLNKAVEVSNGLEIITVAMARAGAGPASPPLQTHNRNVRREICLNIRPVRTTTTSSTELRGDAIHQFDVNISVLLMYTGMSLLKLTQTPSPPTIIVPTSPSCG